MMKNLMLTLSFFMLVFNVGTLFGQVDPSSGQLPKNKIHTTGSDGTALVGGVSVVPLTLSNCNFSGGYVLRVTNLDLLHSKAGILMPCVEAEGWPIPLPSSYPDMFLRFSLGGVVMETIEVTGFETEHCYGLNGWDGPSLYYFKHNLNYNVSNFCVENFDDFQLTVQILTPSPSGSGYIIYPVCNHNDTGDLFDCDWFLDAGCGIPGDPCSDNESANYTPTEIFACRSCGDAEPGGRSDEEKEDEQLLMTQNNLMSISPNPSKDIFTIQWKASIQEATLQLYDLQGKLFYTIKNANYEAGESLKLETADLPSGVYYLHVKGRGTSEGLKLVKI